MMVFKCCLTNVDVNTGSLRVCVCVCVCVFVCVEGEIYVCFI